MAAGPLSLPPERARAWALGHADPRTDWWAWATPAGEIRVTPAARNGLPWVPWDWAAVHRANQLRAEEVFAMVYAAKARVADRLGFDSDGGGHCLADGDYLSIDLALAALIEARRGAA
jgi:hypothetical protein